MNLRLGDLRKRAGYTQQEVSNLVGMSLTEIRNAEHRGIQRRLLKEMIPKLARLYNVSEIDIRKANSNTNQGTSVTTLEPRDENSNDEHLGKIDLRTVFCKLADFNQPIRLHHLRELLKRIYTVEDLVAIDYHETLSMIIKEMPNSDSVESKPHS